MDLDQVFLLASLLHWIYQQFFVCWCIDLFIGVAKNQKVQKYLPDTSVSLILSNYGPVQMSQRLKMEMYPLQGILSISYLMVRVMYIHKIIKNTCLSPFHKDGRHITSWSQVNDEWSNQPTFNGLTAWLHHGIDEFVYPSMGYTHRNKSAD